MPLRSEEQHAERGEESQLCVALGVGKGVGLRSRSRRMDLRRRRMCSAEDARGTMMCVRSRRTCGGRRSAGGVRRSRTHGAGRCAEQEQGAGTRGGKRSINRSGHQAVLKSGSGSKRLGLTAVGWHSAGVRRGPSAVVTSAACARCGCARPAWDTWALETLRCRAPWGGGGGRGSGHGSGEFFGV